MSDTVERAEAAARALCDDATNAALAHLVGESVGTLADSAPLALAAALEVIAQRWRDDAAARAEAAENGGPKRAGSKAAQQRDEHAASLLAGVAVRLRQFAPHECDFVESDGTTAGVCHLPGTHGGRRPAPPLLPGLEKTFDRLSAAAMGDGGKLVTVTNGMSADTVYVPPGAGVLMIGAGGGGGGSKLCDLHSWCTMPRLHDGECSSSAAHLFPAPAAPDELTVVKSGLKVAEHCPACGHRTSLMTACGIEGCEGRERRPELAIKDDIHRHCREGCLCTYGGCMPPDRRERDAFLASESTFVTPPPGSLADGELLIVSPDPSGGILDAVKLTGASSAVAAANIGLSAEFVRNAMYDGQCPNTYVIGEYERCVMPVGHSSLIHVGQRGSRWPVNAPADVARDIYPAPEGQSVTENVPPIARPGIDPQCRFSFVAPVDGGESGETLDCLLVEGHEGDHTDGQSVWSYDPPTIVSPGDLDAFIPCGANADGGDPLCVRPALHTGEHGYDPGDDEPGLALPVIVSAADAAYPTQPFEVAGAVPMIVPPAVSPKTLDIAVIPWAQLTQPPARADELRPAHRSPSQLETYENCSLQYRLQRYAETINVPGVAAIAGGSVHRVIEKAADGRSSDELAVRSELAAHWEAEFEAGLAAAEQTSGISRELFHAANGGTENVEWWRVKGVEMLERYFTWRDGMTADGWSKIASEYEINAPATAERPPLKGFVDEIWHHQPTARVLVTDMKSGRNKPTKILQLGIYGRHVLAEGVLSAGLTCASIASVEAAYLHLRSDRPEVLRHDVVNGTSDAEISFRLATMDRQERAGIYAPNPSNLCSACGVKAACPVGKATS